MEIACVQIGRGPAAAQNVHSLSTSAGSVTMAEADPAARTPIDDGFGIVEDEAERDLRQRVGVHPNPG